MSQKGFGLIEILLVVTVIALLSYGGYIFWGSNKKVDVNNVQQVEDNIKDIRQNPVILHEIKTKAQDDIRKINEQTGQMASSSEDLLK